MYFYWDYRIEGFLFDGFNIDTLQKCIVIIIVVFILAFLNESIKIIQKIITSKLELNWSKMVERTENEAAVNDENTPLVSSLRLLSNDEIKKRRLINHIIQSLLYMINLTIAYFLMNIAMCMYSGHFLAIIFGFAFGYYFLNVASPSNHHETESKHECSHHSHSRHGASTVEDSNRPGTSRSFAGLATLQYDEI